MGRRGLDTRIPISDPCFRPQPPKDSSCHSRFASILPCRKTRTSSTFLAQPGLYLEDLYVRPGFRRSGCGGALLRHLARIAMERRCGRLEWAVLDWNERAIDFYKRQGAVPLNEWTTYRVTGEALERLATGEVTK